MIKTLLFNSASANASLAINKFLNSFKVCGFHLQFLRIPFTFADSTYNLRNPLTVPESSTTSYKYASKIYVTSICTRNPRKSCKWNPLTFWKMFKYLSLESRNIQTQTCAPIQCLVWPRITFFSACNFQN